MKTRFLYIFLMCLVLGLHNCKKSSLPGPSSTPPKPTVLPPETTSGANTFGCLINGRVWVPTDGLGAGQTMGADYFNHVLFVFGNTHDTTEWIQNVSISLGGINQPGTYRIKDHIVGIQNVSCSKDFLDYFFTGDSGYFEITRLDSDNVIMSGRFAFDAVNKDNKNDTVHITQGRFDIKYKH